VTTTERSVHELLARAADTPVLGSARGCFFTPEPEESPAPETASGSCIDDARLPGSHNDMIESPEGLSELDLPRPALTTAPDLAMAF